MDISICFEKAPETRCYRKDEDLQFIAQASRETNMTALATSTLPFQCAVEIDLPFLHLGKDCLSYQMHSIKVKTTNLPVAFEQELLLVL